MEPRTHITDNRRPRDECSPRTNEEINRKICRRSSRLFSHISFGFVRVACVNSCAMFMRMNHSGRDNINCILREKETRVTVKLKFDALIVSVQTWLKKYLRDPKLRRFVGHSFFFRRFFFFILLYILENY